MKKVLEIGCGHGFIARNIVKREGVHYVGIDLSQDNIKEAIRRFPKLQFFCMDAANLKFANNSFNEIYAIDVLEHVDDLDKVIFEVNRVLKKNGVIKINVPSQKSEKWLLKIRPTYFKEIHHVRIFDEDKIMKLFTAYKYKLLKKKSKGFLEHIELYYLFTRKQDSNSQLLIGNRNASILNKVVYASTIIFDPTCLNTPLKYIPIWVLTIPIGALVNLIGNRYFPKSNYYEFIKK